MKKHCRLHSITALFLVLSLVFTGCVSAFADDGDPVELDASGLLWVDARLNDDETELTVWYDADNEEGYLPNGSTLIVGNLDNFVEVDASDGGQVTVQTGSVTNTENGYAPVEVHSFDEGSSVSLITEDVTSEYSTAVLVKAGDGGQAVVSTGDLAGNNGIYAETGSPENPEELEHPDDLEGPEDLEAPEDPENPESISTSITVYAGDIEAAATGVYATAEEEDSSINIYSGNIDAGTTGVYAGAEEEGSSINIYSGDIDAGITGVYAGAFADSSSVFVVTGDIDGGMAGLSAEAYGENSNVYAFTGDISGETVAAYTSATGDQSSVFVFADGDIISTDGIGAALTTYDGGSITLGAEGTISGEAASIALSEGTEADSVQIIAWKVDANEAGHLVETASVVGYNDDELPEYEFTYDEAAKTVEKNILYIIKVEQPKAGGNLKAVNEGGEVVDLALEGDKVLLKIDVAAGYKITGAYNGLGEKIPLLQDAEGNYYVEVEKGGGVYLSATFAKMRKAAVPLLTLKDESGKIEISFFADGSFRAVMEDGSKEKGQFKKDENGQLILVDANGGIITLGEDGAFTYTSTADSTLSYSFMMPEADRETLLKAAK